MTEVRRNARQSERQIPGGLSPMTSWMRASGSSLAANARSSMARPSPRFKCRSRGTTARDLCTVIVSSNPQIIAVGQQREFSALGPQAKALEDALRHVLSVGSTVRPDAYVLASKRHQP